MWCIFKIKIVLENKWMEIFMEFFKNNLGGIEEFLWFFIIELIYFCIGWWCIVISEWMFEIFFVVEIWILVEMYIDIICINEYVLWMVEKCKILLWFCELLKYGVLDF